MLYSTLLENRLFPLESDNITYALQPMPPISHCTCKTKFGKHSTGMVAAILLSNGCTDLASTRNASRQILLLWDPGFCFRHVATAIRFERHGRAKVLTFAVPWPGCINSKNLTVMRSSFCKAHCRSPEAPTDICKIWSAATTCHICKDTWHSHNRFLKKELTIRARLIQLRTCVNSKWSLGLRSKSNARKKSASTSPGPSHKCVR